MMTRKIGKISSAVWVRLSPIRKALGMRMQASSSSSRKAASVFQLARMPLIEKWQALRMRFRLLGLAVCSESPRVNN